MISKKELAIRLCEAESDIEFIYNQLAELEKRLKKVEKPVKPARKVKKDVKVAK